MIAESLSAPNCSSLSLSKHNDLRRILCDWSPLSYHSHSEVQSISIVLLPSAAIHSGALAGRNQQLSPSCIVSLQANALTEVSEDVVKTSN